MPSIYDGSPLELVNNALIYGERDLRQAREYLDECKRQVVGAQISVDHHVEHLARWQEAKRRVLGLPEEENTPPATTATLPGPCTMASKCTPGEPCEHYPPDHPLHVHADCCK